MDLHDDPTCAALIAALLAGDDGARLVLADRAAELAGEHLGAERQRLEWAERLLRRPGRLVTRQVGHDGQLWRCWEGARTGVPALDLVRLAPA